MRRPLCVGLVLATGSLLAFVACGGDDPVLSDTPGASSDASTSETDTGAPPASDAADDVKEGGAPTDASPDAVSPDAGGEVIPPSTTCVTQTFTTGAYNHVGCNANPLTVTPGGVFAVGIYANATNYGQPYCPTPFAIGSAQVYRENGGTFFRFVVLRRTSSDDPGTSSSGTYWVKSNDGSGPIELVEVCDPTNKGKVRSGSLGIRNGNNFVLTFDNGQESWTLQ